MRETRQTGELGHFLISNEEYHASDGISSTSFKNILKSPKEFKWHRDNKKEPTTAMRFGTAAHEFILEPDKFSEHYAIEPKIEKVLKKDDPVKYEDNKKLLAKFAEESKGKEIIKADDAEKLILMRLNVENYRDDDDNLVWDRFKEDAEIEHSYYANIHGTLCKARPDLKKPKFIADLKTTNADLDTYSLLREIKKFNYHLSAAMYLKVVDAVIDDSPESFIWVFVQNKPPFGVRMLVAPIWMLDSGDDDFLRALVIYQDCLSKDEWPGYTGLETPEKPRWWE